MLFCNTVGPGPGGAGQTDGRSDGKTEILSLWVCCPKGKKEERNKERKKKERKEKKRETKKANRKRKQKTRS